MISEPEIMKGITALPVLIRAQIPLDRENDRISFLKKYDCVIVKLANHFAWIGVAGFSSLYGEP